MTMNVKRINNDEIPSGPLFFHEVLPKFIHLFEIFSNVFLELFSFLPTLIQNYRLEKMYLNQQLSSLIYLHHLLVIYFFLIYDADTRVL